MEETLVGRAVRIRQFREHEIDPSVAAALIRTLYRDMQEHGNDLAPSPIWRMGHFFPGMKRIPTFDEMMGPWVGAKALRQVTGEDIDVFSRFLAQGGYDWLVSDFVDDRTRLTDLGTLVDISMFDPYVSEDAGHFNYLEIGCGYGRLAEAVMGTYKSVRCVLVDAVPETLAYAYLYLSQAFPDKVVGLYTGAVHRDFADYDCVLVPAWHFEKENTLGYDLVACVSSLQEMRQDQVDRYIGLVDRAVRPGGIVYMFNTRDYYKLRFRYPERWRLLRKVFTPKSWSPDYPAEVFRVGRSGVIAGAVAGEEERYLRELVERYREAYYRKEAQARAQARRLDELGRRLAGKCLWPLVREVLRRATQGTLEKPVRLAKQVRAGTGER